MARLEGIVVADGSVILLATHGGDGLLATDSAVIEVARSLGVDCWWVTTLLLTCATAGTVRADQATDILYDLVNEGMNLHPHVYARIHEERRALGE